MGKIVQSTILNSSQKEVWKFITNPKNFSAYVHGYAGGKTVSQNEAGIGVQYEWCGRVGPFKIKSREKVVEWRDRKRVAYSGTMGGVPFNSSMTIKKIKKQTQLTVSIEYAVPSYFGGVITDALLIRWIVKDHVKKSLDALKERY